MRYTFVDVIFKLLRHFINWDEQKFADLKKQADEWYNTNINDENHFLGKHRDKLNLWYVQAGLAVFTILSIKWGTDWLMGKFDAVNVHDDDDDDDTVATPVKRTIAGAIQKFDL